MTTTLTTTPANWSAAWRAFEYGETVVDVETAEPVTAIDETLPVFEVHYRGRVFARSNNHAITFRFYRAMFDGRPFAANAKPELVVVNDRREVAR